VSLIRLQWDQAACSYELPVVFVLKRDCFVKHCCSWPGLPQALELAVFASTGRQHPEQELELDAQDAKNDAPVLA
jgi:hypothetical protein